MQIQSNNFQVLARNSNIENIFSRFAENDLRTRYQIDVVVSQGTRSAEAILSFLLIQQIVASSPHHAKRKSR